MKRPLGGIVLALLIFVLSSCEKTDENYLLSPVPPTMSWGAPQIIDSDTMGGIQSNPKLGMDAQGNAVAVWAQSPQAGGNSSIVACRMIGRIWGVPRPIDNRDDSAYSPEVSVAPDGTAVAVWYHSGSPYRLCAARMKADGTWETPQQIASTNQYFWKASIATDASGTAVAIWPHLESSTQRIRASRMDASGSWSPSQDVDPDSTIPDYPVLVMDGQGRALTVWIDYDGSSQYQVKSNTMNPQGTWESPQVIQTTTSPCTNPSLAMDSAGNAVATWRAGNAIWACYRSGGAWGTPVQISPSGFNAYQATTAMVGVGQAVSVFYQNSGSTDSVYAVHFTNGAWSTPEGLEQETGYAAYPWVASNGNGSAIAVWQQQVTPSTYIWSSHFNQGRWGGSWYIENLDGSAGDDPCVAMSPNGTAVAVWTKSTPPSRQRVYANRYGPN